MRCPKCGNYEDKVLDSRNIRDGNAIRRRRECLACGYRYTTFEEALKVELHIIKRDGRSEEFSRQKLISSISRACAKLPIRQSSIEDVASSIENELMAREQLEIPSSEVGELVMQALEKIDQVAFVRFASVYHRFTLAKQFADTVSNIGKKLGAKDDPSKPS